jgi:hypothetical protein
MAQNNIELLQLLLGINPGELKTENEQKKQTLTKLQEEFKDVPEYEMSISVKEDLPVESLFWTAINNMDELKKDAFPGEKAVFKLNLYYRGDKSTRESFKQYSMDKYGIDVDELKKSMKPCEKSDCPCSKKQKHAL